MLKSCYKILLVKFYSEIMLVCAQKHTKTINRVCGQKVELLNIKLVVHMLTTGL